MAIQAQFCVPMQSRWVISFILTCDGNLAVTFKKHGVCCLYPGTTPNDFELAVTWGSPGRYVHRFLYKKRAYRLIKNPCPPVVCNPACCSNVSVPTILHCTITDQGGCACLAGTYTLTWDGVSKWVYTGNVCGVTNFQLVFECIMPTGVFGLAMTDGSGIGSTHQADFDSTCTPFVQNFDDTPFNLSTTCSGSVTAIVTH